MNNIIDMKDCPMQREFLDKLCMAQKETKQPSVVIFEQLSKDVARIFLYTKKDNSWRSYGKTFDYTFWDYIESEKLDENEYSIEAVSTVMEETENWILEKSGWAYTYNEERVMVELRYFLVKCFMCKWNEDFTDYNTDIVEYMINKHVVLPDKPYDKRDYGLFG